MGKGARASREGGFVIGEVNSADAWGAGIAVGEAIACALDRAAF
jgi:hypothetical protein